MTISGAITGATNAGITGSPITYALPTTGYDADSYTVCAIAWGGPSPFVHPDTASTGWDFLGSANGGSAATYNTNVGPRGIAFFGKAGASPGAPAISCYGSNGVQVGRCMKFQKTKDNWAVPEFVSVVDSSSGTTFSGTLPSDPGAVAGDMALLGTSYVDRAATPSSPSISWPGMTVASPDLEASIATASGRAARLVAYSSELTGGPSSGAPSFSFTTSAATTGIAGMLLLSEYDDPPPVDEWPKLGRNNAGVFQEATAFGINDAGVFVPAKGLLLRP